MYIKSYEKAMFKSLKSLFTYKLKPCVNINKPLIIIIIALLFYMKI